MKTILIILFIAVIPSWLTAQPKIPEMELRTVDGIKISSATMFESGQPSVVIFWNSYNNRCCDNIENMQSVWLNQLKDKGVKLIAICVDCNGNWNYVKPFVNGKAWEFDIYIDLNGDFKRAMGITDAPYTVLLDKNQKVVCRSSGYCSGNEEFVCQKILHCLEEAELDTGLQANAEK
jgi:cytochrome c biogenesis protein CcmG, thiol:disulfide interchange protein DsbE